MSDLVSLCVLRLEVNETDGDSGAMASGEEDTRKPREISVETFPSRLEAPREDWGLLPAPANRERQTSMNESEGEEIGFFSGNPFVELTKGVLHLYKEDALRGKEEARCLCLLGVPAAMTCHDLLAFTAPCHADIAHIRVLRDTTPNQYMALLAFRGHTAAAEFHETYDGTPFSGLEPERVCRVVWVSRVEWAPPNAPPPLGHTELPTCPVCLERMDESVDGVLTILCNHAFHAGCLSKWGDSTCPVCRCVQSPELADASECFECGDSAAAPTATDSLWICLICGHVGCGRYQGGHAAQHYRDSGHCYALQLGSHRVWDYKGDNFVHRLVQNKGDGKLVASEGRPNATGAQSPEAEDKVDAMQLEFTYLLTSQLDAQRQYFEEKLTRLETELRAGGEALTAANKEKRAAEKRASQLAQRLNVMQSELAEERQLGKALRGNQAQWQARVNVLEEQRVHGDNEIKQLKEQIRDLMFYLDAQQVIANSADRDDIAGGTVTVATSSDGNTNKPHRNRNRNKR